MQKHFIVDGSPSNPPCKRTDDKLPPILIKNLRGLMLRQDLESVNRFEKFTGIFAALKSYCKFRLYYCLSELRKNLEKRRDAMTDD